MAVAFARGRFIGRSDGGSATRTAAYNLRGAIWDERKDIGHDFSYVKGANVFHEILAPADQVARPLTASALWNMAEMSENRRDSRVAREIILRLPSGPEITGEDRIELARSFAEQHFVRNGLAVQVDIHEPELVKDGKKIDPGSEAANWHAHLLVTTRRLEAGHLSETKARDLEPPVRRGRAGRKFVTDNDAWGDVWRHHQDAFFRRMGYVTRVDVPGIVPGKAHGPTRHRKNPAAAEAQSEAVRQANAEASRDPERVLAALVKGNATFAVSDLDRFLKKHLPSTIERPVVRKAVLGLAVPLFERETGERTGRYTAASVRDAEQSVLRGAAAVEKSRHKAVAQRRAPHVARLYPDQKAAYLHAASARGLAIISGRAGTGKSVVASSLRESLTAAGYNVRGLGPTNQVAEQLRRDGFTGARTVHAELYAMDKRRYAWNQRTAVVIDEAAMLSTPVLGRVMAYAAAAKARVVLAGDDRQLGAVAAPGGMFRELAERHGTAEVTKVIRQSVDWQRQASEDLSEGRYAEALRAYQEHHAIHWTQRAEYAKASLVAHWAADSEGAGRSASTFVLAYTNKEVDDLNAELRAVRIDRGEIEEGVHLPTKHGTAEFSVGDRIQFTQTAKPLGISNGNAGTLTSVGDRLEAKLDDGRTVSWSPDEFDGWRHGYAGTIYKAQGRTLDRAYVLHSWHLSAQASYVALTRHTQSVSLYVSRTVARDMGALIRQMARTEERGASLQWATEEEAPKRKEAVPVIHVQEPTRERPKLIARSAIAMAIERYEATRPRSDLDVWATEVVRGFREFDDLLEQVISLRLEQAGPDADHYAVMHKALDETSALVDRAEAIAMPTAARQIARTDLQYWALEMAAGNATREDVVQLARAIRLSRGETGEAVLERAEKDVTEAIQQLEPVYSARVIKRELEMRQAKERGQDYLGELAQVGRRELSQGKHREIGHGR